MKVWSAFLALAGIVLVWGSPPAVAGPVEDVQRWLSHLKDNERHQAVLDWSDPERRHTSWGPGMRAGLPLRAMRPEVQTGMRALLKAQLSPGGFEAVRTVLSQERILQKIQGSDIIGGTPLFLGSDPEPFDESFEPKVLLLPLLTHATPWRRTFESMWPEPGFASAFYALTIKSESTRPSIFTTRFTPRRCGTVLPGNWTLACRTRIFHYDALGLEIEGGGAGLARCSHPRRRSYAWHG